MSGAYPLAWPPARTRTSPERRHRAAFKGTAFGAEGRSYKREKTIAEAETALLRELRRLGASRVVVSSNLVRNVDGSIRSNQKPPADPGAAVFFRYKGQDVAFANDPWDRAVGIR